MMLDLMRKGTTRVFNEKGRQQKKLNYNKRFNLKLHEVVSIGRKVLRTDEHEEMYVSRNFNKKNAFWIIEFKMPDDAFFYKYFIINDKTKEVKIASGIAKAEKLKLEKYDEEFLELKKYFKD